MVAARVVVRSSILQDWNPGFPGISSPNAELPSGCSDRSWRSLKQKHHTDGVFLGIGKIHPK
jgi:hypothetical protein